MGRRPVSDDMNRNVAALSECMNYLASHKRCNFFMLADPRVLLWRVPQKIQANLLRTKTVKYSSISKITT
jgi:hypothetical protein